MSGSLISLKESLLILALCAGAYFLSSRLPDAPLTPNWNFGSDSNVYMDLADNIMSGHGYVHSPGIDYPGTGIHSKNASYIHSLHLLPGYPLLLAGSMRLFGYRDGPYSLAFILFSLMAFCSFATAKLLFRDRLQPRTLWTAFILFQILQPILLLQLQAIARDLASACSISIFVFLLLRLTQTKQTGFLSSLLFLLSAFIAVCFRTNVFALMLPLVLSFGLYFVHRKELKKAALLGMSILVVVICVAGWSLRLKRLTGVSMLGIDQGIGLYVNYAYFNVPVEVREQAARDISSFFERRLQAGDSVDQSELAVCRAYQKKAVDFLKENPLRAARITAKNLLITFLDKDYFWMPRILFIRSVGEPLQNYNSFHDIFARHFSWPRAALYEAANIACYLLYVAFPVGCLFFIPLVGWRQYRRSAGGSSETSNLFLWLTILAFSAILFLIATALFGAQARYRMPVSIITYSCILGVVWILSPGQSDPEARKA